MVSSPALSTRLAWTDVAKGLAIILVVVHHAVMFSDAVGWLPGSVVELNRRLAAFRMPLFFLASGLFAGPALAKSWRVVADRRLAPWIYLYVLWVLLRIAFFAVVPDVRGTDQVSDLGELAREVFVPQTGLWFLYALAAFTVAAKAMRRVPAAVQIGLAAVLSALVMSDKILIDAMGWWGMCAYYVFFLVGMHASGFVKAAAARASVGSTVVLAVAAVVATVGVTRLGLQFTPGAQVVQACLAVAAGVSLSAVLAETPLGSLLQYLGGRTLPIYLAHILWISAGVVVLEGLLHPGGLLGVALMLALVATGVPMSLLARAGAERARMGWLFDLPRRARVEGAAPAHRASVPATQR